MRSYFRLIFFLIFTIMGCGSADITVTPMQVGISPESGQNGNVGFGEGLPESSRASGRIYFKRVFVDHGRIDTILALSFSLSDSKTTIPFGFPIRLQSDLSVRPVFGVDAQELDYLSVNGNRGATLMRVSMNEMKSQILSEIPVPIVGFSLNRSSNQIAWIDLQGKVRISALLPRISIEESTVLNSPIANPDRDHAISLEWDHSGNHLLVQTEGGSALVYSKKEHHLVFSQGVSNSLAAAFNPDFSQIIFIRQDHTLILADLTSEQSVTLHPISNFKLPNGAAFDLSWSSSNLISYWIRTEEGTQEIQTLNLSSGSKSTLAKLDIPLGTGSGIVCPAWVGNAVYFGNFLNGMYLIERIRFGSTQNGKREIFAMPPASDEGLTCPKTERLGSA